MNEENGFASTRVMQPMWDDRHISDRHYYRSQWAWVICNGIDIRCVLVGVVPPFDNNDCVDATGFYGSLNRENCMDWIYRNMLFAGFLADHRVRARSVYIDAEYIKVSMNACIYWSVYMQVVRLTTQHLIDQLYVLQQLSVA